MANVWRGRIIWLLGCLLLGVLPVAAQSSIMPIYVVPRPSGIAIHVLPDATTPLLMLLNTETPLGASGRTEDSRWIKVELSEDVEGWVSSEYVRSDMLDQTTMLPITTPDAALILQLAPFWNFGTPNIREIYARGQAEGRRADFFSVVGDSISASPMFLQPIGYGVYDLGTFGYLQPVLERFGTHEASPFRTPSVAVRTGWSTQDVLNPEKATRQGCPPGTVPLTCEYMFSNPAFAVIMLGTNDATMMDVTTFERNLNQVVELSIEANVVPMLSTVPPLLLSQANEQAHNLAIIRVAQAHNVPLVNLWLAVQPLPNLGMSDDGVHLSGPPSNAGTTLFNGTYIEYGYTMRNLVTLQGLEMLLRQTS